MSAHLHPFRGAVAVAALATLLAAAAVQPAPASRHLQTGAVGNSTTFQDSVGEEVPTAPDISTVIVSNDDAGLLSFEIRFANRPALPPNEELSLWFDTDLNPATGLLGSDRFIELIGNSLTLTDWESYDTVPAATLAFTAGASTITIRVGTKDLGVTGSFRFYVWTDGTPDSEGVENVDVAPDEFWNGWTYEVKVAPPQLALSPLTCTPKLPRAGGLAVAGSRASFARGGIAESLPVNATATWAASVGSAQLRPRAIGRTTGGTLTSTWRMPATAKGKLLRVRLTVTAENVTSTRSASCRVR